MGTQFVTAIGKGEDSFSVGRNVASQAMDKLGGNKADLVIVFSSTKYAYPEVLKGITSVTGNAPLIGCSAAGEFTEEQVDNESIVCALISSDIHKFSAGLGANLSTDEIGAIQSAMQTFPESEPGYANKAAIMLIDGLIGKGEESTLGLLTLVGNEVKIVGGTAADDYKFKETQVFCNGQAASNSVSMAMVYSKKPLAIGVQHGHIPISPAFTITKSVGNCVYELDGKPAVDVWKEYTREPARQLGIDVDTMWENPEQLGRFTCIFEGGVDIGGQYKVRWTGLNAEKNDCLPFVCTMPEGTVLRIMQSSKEQQLSSARQAALSALSNNLAGHYSGAIVFDCAVRGALLGEDFHKEVETFKEQLKCPLIGCATYGEIAREVNQLSGFHNTTSVVLLLP